MGSGWGLPGDGPIVRAALDAADLGTPVARTDLEIRPDAAFLRFTNEFDGPLLGFGERLLHALQPQLARIGAWKPGELTTVRYFDRYLKSPLTMRLALDFVAAMQRSLATSSIEVELVSEPFRADPRYENGSPWQVKHDWRDDAVRGDVAATMGAALQLELTLQLRRDQHARQFELLFSDGTSAVLVLDQGFGSWLPPTEIPVSFDFTASASDQAHKLLKANLLVHRPDHPSYLVAHRK